MARCTGRRPAGVALMRAAVYEGKGEVNLRDVPIPVIEPGEVLLAIEACGVCGVDLRTWKNGDAKIVPPRILGHECVGRVVETRSDLPGAPAKGTRVAVYVPVPCGTCSYCASNRANLCDHRTTLAYQHDGALAKFMRIPAASVRFGSLVPVRDDLPAPRLALAEPLGCVAHAHAHLSIGPADTVAVIGAGPIGAMHAVLSRLEGARQVILLDTSAPRLKLAERFGLDGYVVVKERAHLDELKALTRGQGPTVVIVACGSAAAQADALEMAAKGGRIEFFGGLPKSSPTAVLNTNFIHYKELAISGSFSERLEDFRRAVALVQDPAFPAEAIVTHELPLERMPEAFALMESGAALKVCIRP